MSKEEEAFTPHLDFDVLQDIGASCKAAAHRWRRHAIAEIVDEYEWLESTELFISDVERMAAALVMFTDDLRQKNEAAGKRVVSAALAISGGYEGEA